MKRILIMAMFAIAAISANAGIVFDHYTGITSGFLAPNGGSGLDPASTTGASITKLTATKLSYNAALYGGQSLTSFTWVVSNTSTLAITARMRVRFYADNVNMPGTIISGLTFGATSLAAGGSAWAYNPAAGTVVLPTSGVIWAGITFDNSGVTATSQADLNNLGTFLADEPPTVGVQGTANNDEHFLSTNQTNGFFSNVPGTILNYGVNSATNRPLNQLWKLEATAAVPEPATYGMLGLGALAFLRRRRLK